MVSLYFLEEALAFVSKAYQLNRFPSDNDHEAGGGHDLCMYYGLMPATVIA